MVMLGKPIHEAHDERLRIVSDALWERVKARQRSRMHTIGRSVRGGLRKRGGGGGRPAKYLFTGLLACGECGASFVMRNRAYYACGSYWHGRACSNAMNVSRALVERVLLAGLREDLRSETVIQEVERRVRAAVREQRRPPSHGKRIAELEQEVGHLVEAVASGLLRRSPTLAARLDAAEAELARLRSLQAATPLPLAVPNVRGRFLALVDRLDTVLMRDPERGREELRGILGERIVLSPDAKKGHLWAEYSMGCAALLPARAASADLMVAGAGFEPATFGL